MENMSPTHKIIDFSLSTIVGVATVVSLYSILTNYI